MKIANKAIFSSLMTSNEINHRECDKHQNCVTFNSLDMLSHTLSSTISHLFAWVPLLLFFSLLPFVGHIFHAQVCPKNLYCVVKYC